MSDADQTEIKTPLLRPTRRRFLATTSAGVLAAGLGTGLSTAGARAQTRGGTIRVAKGHGSTGDTLDPATTENGYMIALTYGLNGFLTGIGTDGSVEPELAESWEASDDATVWRIVLRQGVTFHDGRDVTAEDVVASIQYHRGEDSASAAKTLLKGITDIAIDGGDVVFTLASGDADFPFTLADYHLAILPSSEGAVDWRSGIGCGPYELVSFDPGVEARLERNADDWNQARGFFDAVEMLSITDANARTSAFVSGDVHAIDRIDLKTVDLMSRNPGVTIHSVDGNQHFTFAMSTNQDPFTDRNVRLALKHAINREELVEKLLFGYGSVGNDHPIGRGQRFYNDELEQTSYDPDRAKFHLREAGLDSLNVEVAAADAAFAGAVDAATLFQASAAAGGIDLQVARKPNDGYWSDVWMQHPFSAVYWGGRPTEDGALSIAYAAGAAWNDTFWDNARFNELLVQARSELEETTRRGMYFELQQILNQDGGVIAPMFANYVFGTREEIVTGELSAHWDMDGERWMERWSFA
ncbi:MAG: ABC transporter substrate-binding protein [Pseudomonadota bacterium]